MNILAKSLAVAAVCLATAIPATADNHLMEDARAALTGFTAAVVAGPAETAKWLAPEYQIMRSNGVGYDRDGYLNRGVPQIHAAPEFSHENVVVTESGDIMVVRYFLRIDEVIEGRKIAKRAPRLTVFRRVGGMWKVVAHANFGAGAAK